MSGFAMKKLRGNPAATAFARNVALPIRPLVVEPVPEPAAAYGFGFILARCW